MDAERTAKVLRELASRVRRLMPLNHEPERFHVEKSEIIRDLTSMAEEFAPSPGGRTAEKPVRTANVVMTGTHRINGRTVHVERRRRRMGFAISV